MKTVLLLLFLCPVVLWAQAIKITPEDTQRKQSYLIMRDGSILKGQIIRQDSTIITVRKHNGDMSFVEVDQLTRISANRPDQEAGVAGQTRSTSPYTVFIFKDGSQVEGAFIRRDSTMITVRKRNGQLTYFEPELLVRTDSVQAQTYPDSSRTYRNRFAPWLLTGQTAYNPEKGRFYYRNTWLLFNEFDYGITSFWSVGASFIAPIPYLIYADEYYGSGQYLESTSKLFTKISASIGPSFRLGVSATYQANQLYTYNASRGVWTLQALASIGTSQNNVTIGYGIAVPRSQRLVYATPVSGSSIPQYIYTHIPNQTFLSLGIMQKVSPGLTLVSDNRINLGTQYSFYTEERVTTSFALRIDRPRHAFDLGLFGFIYQKPELYNNKAVRIFPYLGYNLIIGRD